MGATHLSRRSAPPARGDPALTAAPSVSPSPQPGKTDLRRVALSRRAGLSDEARARASAGISDAVIALDLVPGAAVAAYLPIRGEVDLGAALSGLDGRGHAIGLPVTSGDGMLFRRWRPGEPLVPLAFGTRGPAEGAPLLVPDVILLPLAAYDGRGGRIGYGRGFYDRAIAALSAAGHRPRLIGVAFSVQEVETIPLEPHDVPLDLVITERGTVVPTP